MEPAIWSQLAIPRNASSVNHSTMGSSYEPISQLNKANTNDDRNDQDVALGEGLRFY